MRFIIYFIFSFSLISKGFSQSHAESIERHREEYKAEFLKSSNSPLNKENIEHLKFYEASENYKVECQFVATKGGKPFEIPTSSGVTKSYRKFGELHFQIDDVKYKLTVYQSMSLLNNPLYKDYLFIPFKDLTNGKESYGGGRYIDLRMKEIEGDKIYLDFNKCYNPYCAYTTGYSCPIPPKENHLKIPIEAGEKMFK